MIDLGKTERHMVNYAVDHGIPLPMTVDEIDAKYQKGTKKHSKATIERINKMDEIYTTMCQAGMNPTLI